MMPVIVNGKNFEVSEAMRERVTQRMQKLERHFHFLQDAHVTLSTQRNWQIAEVTLQAAGHLLRAEERSNDMHASLDSVFDKVERQLRRHKERLSRKGRGAGEEESVATTEEEPAAGGAAEAPVESVVLPRVVRTKRFVMKPMSVEEAALQMELLGHDFFMFTNAETETINVLYRRKDGDLGLIEPGP
jgi:putative sigma-54 modulation protein